MEKRRHAIEEAKAQAKGLLPAGTQVLDSTSGFSPAPKLGECWGVWPSFPPDFLELCLLLARAVCRHQGPQQMFGDL